MAPAHSLQPVTMNALTYSILLILIKPLRVENRFVFRPKPRFPFRFQPAGLDGKDGGELRVLSEKGLFSSSLCRREYEAGVLYHYERLKENFVSATRSLQDRIGFMEKKIRKTET